VLRSLLPLPPRALGGGCFRFRLVGHRACFRYPHRPSRRPASAPPGGLLPLSSTWAP